MKQILKWTQLAALLLGGILVLGLSPAMECISFLPSQLHHIPSQTLNQNVAEKELEVSIYSDRGDDFMDSYTCFIELYLVAHNPSDALLTLEIAMVEKSISSIDGGVSDPLEELDAGPQHTADTPNTIATTSLTLEAGETYDGDPFDEMEDPALRAASPLDRPESTFGLNDLSCHIAPNIIFSVQAEGDEQLELSGMLLYGVTSLESICDPIHPNSGPSCCVPVSDSSEVDDDEEIPSLQERALSALSRWFYVEAAWK